MAHRKCTMIYYYVLWCTMMYYDVLWYESRGLKWKKSWEGVRYPVREFNEQRTSEDRWHTSLNNQMGKGRQGNYNNNQNRAFYDSPSFFVDSLILLIFRDIFLVFYGSTFTCFCLFKEYVVKWEVSSLLLLFQMRVNLLPGRWGSVLPAHPPSWWRVFHPTPFFIVVLIVWCVSRIFRRVLNVFENVYRCF